MKFEITGDDLKGINDSLDYFIKEFEKGYEESLGKAKKSRKAKMFGLTKKIENIMPDFIMHTHYIKDDKVILKNTLPDNALARKVGMYKRSIKGVEGYLKWKGFKDVKVKIIKHEVD